MSIAPKTLNDLLLSTEFKMGSGYSSSGHINELKKEENSQIRNAVSLKKPSKEVTEEIKTVDQNQVTLKNGTHGKKANENHKEDVNSLPTIKKDEALQQNSSK